MGIKVMKEINGKQNMNKNKIYHFIKERKLVFPLFFVILICYPLYVVYMMQYNICFIYYIKKYQYTIIC